MEEPAPESPQRDTMLSRLMVVVDNINDNLQILVNMADNKGAGIKTIAFPPGTKTVGRYKGARGGGINKVGGYKRRNKTRKKKPIRGETRRNKTRRNKTRRRRR